MNRKFAVLNYAGSHSEIILKYKILRKAPAKVLDWYIYKFNPYKKEDINILEENGYNTKLPVLSEAAGADPERTAQIVHKTVLSLMEYGVDIILPPNGTDISHVDNISIATGKDIYPFFLIQAIKKAIKTVRKDMRTVEILIIAGSGLTESVLYNIYEEINYLSIMFKDNRTDDFVEIAENIFDDNGLNIQLVGFNKNILASADIVINTGEMDERLFYSFKRGAILFDLSSERYKRMELIRKRGDLLVVDDFRLKCEDEFFSLSEFELPFYVKSREFRTVFLRGYEQDMAKRIKRQLDDLNVTIAAFKSLDNIVNSVSINNFISKL